MRGKKDHTKERGLRVNQTEAGARLWVYLRNQRTFNKKFRRQHRVGPYIVDFICTSAYLVLELDGSQHLDAKTYDATRTNYLNSHGYRVLRFWNNEVLARTAIVLETIAQALTAPHPPSAPSPR